MSAMGRVPPASSGGNGVSKAPRKLDPARKGHCAQRHIPSKGHPKSATVFSAVDLKKEASEDWLHYTCAHSAHYAPRAVSRDGETDEHRKCTHPGTLR